jgi:hypothetical protein
MIDEAAGISLALPSPSGSSVSLVAGGASTVEGRRAPFLPESKCRLRAGG